VYLPLQIRFGVQFGGYLLLREALSPSREALVFSAAGGSLRHPMLTIVPCVGESNRPSQPSDGRKPSIFVRASPPSFGVAIDAERGILPQPVRQHVVEPDSGVVVDEGSIPACASSDRSSDGVKLV
jgi:hypothetical protein